MPHRTGTFTGLTGQHDHGRIIQAGKKESKNMNDCNLTMEQRAGSLRAGTTILWLFFCGLMLVFNRPVMAAQGPVEVLRSMTATLEEIVQQDPDVINDLARLRVIAHDVVLPHVDIRIMSRWVLGKNWRKATKEQRETFVIEFRELLLGTYLRQVNTYEGEVVHFLPSNATQKEGRAVVNAEIEQPNGPAVHVIFRLHKVKDDWLIYDVVVEGISLVATHRSSFNNEIRNSGIDALIARLHKLNERNAEEASGIAMKARAEAKANQAPGM
jgi:phospholipid transport system substrate-binding protein